MTRRITRRAAAKLVLSASAALALPNPIDAESARKTPLVLSPSERKLLEKSVGQLRGAARKIQQMKIPMGTEPAFVFRARLPKK